MVAEMDGGPVAAADLESVVANPVSITLTCSLVTTLDGGHTAPAVVSSSGTGVAVAAVPPTVASFPASLDPGVGICAAVTLTDRAGETHDLYWTQDRTFSTDATSACVFWCTAEGYPFGPDCSGPGLSEVAALLDPERSVR
jgi:hypothetical protein